jgi:putative ABC transport system permease protein
MWRNYLTVGLRALAKNKTYAFINIFGLALGLAACLLILLYVRYELAYDAWLPNAENSYQFQSHYRDDDTGEENKLQMTSFVAGTALKKDFPQVDKTVYALSNAPVVLRGGEALPTEDVLLVDNLFFDVLQFPLVKGDPGTALRQVNSLVVTETEAGACSAPPTRWARPSPWSAAASPPTGASPASPRTCRRTATSISTWSAASIRPAISPTRPTS